MLNWTDKQNGVDTIDADDINSVANAVVTLETDSATMKADIVELNKLPAKVSTLEVEVQNIKNDIGLIQIAQY